MVSGIWKEGKQCIKWVVVKEKKVSSYIKMGSSIWKEGKQLYQNG